MDRKIQAEKACAELGRASANAKLAKQVREFAADPKWEVRKVIAEALAYLPEAIYRELVADLHGDSNAFVRSAAQRSVEKRTPVSNLAEATPGKIQQAFDKITSRLGSEAAEAAVDFANKITELHLRTAFHDIKNILASFNLDAEELRKAVPDQKRKIDRYEQGCAYLRRLAEMMDKYSEPLTITVVPEPIAEIIREAQASAVTLVENDRRPVRGVKLSVDAPEDLVVPLSRFHIVMVLTNLIKNGIEAHAVAALTQPYHQGREHLRYYQDAAIRSATEQIIVHRQSGKPPRILLNLATGSGKTRIAAALLRKLVDAGLVQKALFLCDRTELRENGLGDFQGAFGNDAAEVSTRESQKNAKVLIATYQTLDHKDGGTAFFEANYPPGFFDAIVIDECHRSAWSDWFRFLKANTDAIQIGLTATPRQIVWPEPKNEEEAKAFAEDQRRVADNLEYFGAAVYEYPYLQGVEDGYLAPCEVEAYTVHHDGRVEAEHVRGVPRDDLRDKQLTHLLTGQKVEPEELPPQNAPAALGARLILTPREKAMCEHLFGRLLATNDNDPLQKTIIFCQSDYQADLVANELNRHYSAWCKAHNQKRRRQYAFKCMSSTDGQSLIPDFRGSSSSYFIATTKDLLSTGVDVPRVRNIVFFRFLQSAILFAQMFGRGTRLAEGKGKLMFRVFDYTGVTALFGKPFITPPPPEGGDGGGGGEGPPKTRSRGGSTEIKAAGVFNILSRDGQPARVTPQEYQAAITNELLAQCPTLAQFRAAWIIQEERETVMKDLERRGLLPEKLREIRAMDEYDLFDVLAAVTYGITPRSRAERAAALAADGAPEWLVRLPLPAAKVIRAIARQFERGGTSALETTELWHADDPDLKNGIRVLKQAGDPAELVHKTKEALFVA